MDSQDYEEKLEAIVDSEAYTTLTKNPSITLDNKIRKIVRQLKKIPTTPRNIATQLISENFRLPAIYGAPKVHKEGLPLRPIVTSYGTATEKCAKFVSRVLKTILQEQSYDTCLLNSEQLVKSLRSHQFPRHFTLVSFDIKNMFGSLNPTRCKAIVLDLVRMEEDFENKFEIPKSFFVRLLDICFESNYFIYKDVFYKQEQGIPMGSPCSPMIAETYLRYLEQKVRSLPLYKYINLWNRYIDDIIAVWTGTSRLLQLFLKELNKLDQDVKFTVEEESDNQLPYLDVLITKQESGVTTSMFSKPSSAGLVLNYDSFHPASTKFSTIAGETNRTIKLSDNKQEDLKKLENKFVNNGYPRQQVQRTIDRTCKRVTPNAKNDSNKTTLVLPFLGKLTNKIKRKAKNHSIQLVSKRGRTLGNIFSQSYKYSTTIPSNVVYKISCKCGQFYVGETGKTLEKRVSQHKNAVLNGDPNNGLAVHVQQTGHKIDWNSATILEREANFRKRKIREAIKIQHLKPTLNLQDGYRLRGQWSNFLATWS